MRWKSNYQALYRLLNIRALHSLIKDNSTLVKSGWFESVKRNVPVDQKGNPIPWMTYPLLSFITQRLNKDMRIFEYGSGNSTLWWATNVRHVSACEHDRSWYDQLKHRLPDNVDLHYEKLEVGGEYSRYITKYQNCFDIIVIDGRDRIACAKNALNALTDEGVIIWDNSDRDDYEEGYNYLMNCAFRRLDFWGMGPINNYAWCSSIFYRDNNILKI